MMKYVAPEFLESAFTCPQCDVYSKMTWSNLLSNHSPKGGLIYSYFAALCDHCDKHSIWLAGYEQDTHNLMSTDMLHPSSTGIPSPSEDMPNDVKKDYLEAASIYQKSPRGAVALLRLGLQKLCVHLGGDGEKINADLAKLAENELVSKKLIRSADIIRIVGNNAVHPGTISDDDFDDVSLKLFTLINMIVQQGITEPKEVDDIFGSMPKGARQAAENRDKPKQK